MKALNMPARDSTRLDYTERMRDALHHIQRHLDESMSPAELAKVACFAPHHFHRVFKGMIGETIMEHVRRLRLERAAWRLTFTEQSVTDIAFDAQYENHESFTRAFGRMFGESPSAFRKRRRTIEYPPARSGIHYRPEGEDPMIDPDTPACETIGPRIERFPDRRVLYVRHVGPYLKCKCAWDTLMAHAAANGLIGPGVEMIGLCHDDPDVTPAEKIRYDACITAPERATASGKIGIQIIPGGEYAIERHRGPYETLEHAYARLFGSAIPKLGRTPAPGACVEKYWNDPESTNPDDLETDISVLLA